MTFRRAINEYGIEIGLAIAVLDFMFSSPPAIRYFWPVIFHHLDPYLCVYSYEECYTDPMPMESFERNLSETPQSKNELMEKAEQLQNARVAVMKLKEQLSVPMEPSKGILVIKSYRDAVLSAERIEEEFNAMKQTNTARLEKKFAASYPAADRSANDSDFDRALYATEEEHTARKLDVRKKA